jgi:hypothetical protein
MISFRLAPTVLLLAALVGVACYDPNQITAPDDIFLISASPSTIPANGFSTSRITVRVDSATNRELTFGFKSDGGTLSIPESQVRGPDANGEISVFLKSDTTPRTVLVTAEAKNGQTIVSSRSIAVTFESAAPDTVIRLSASPSRVEADGASSIQLRADTNAGLTDRTVTFTATNGSFQRGANPPDRDVEVPTSADGIAIIQLYAPTEVGAAVVTAAAGGFSASQTVTFLPLSVRLVVSSSRIESDGASSLQLRAETTPGSSRAVTFRTTLGTFDPSSSSPVRELPNRQSGADGVAVAQLYATGEVGTAIVTATAGGFSDSQPVTFSPAAPDFVTLRAAPTTVSRAQETNFLTLTASLSRAVGAVSPNTRVEFTAVNDASGESFGRFEEVTRSGANGQTTAKFIAGTTAPLGLATITARVVGTDVSSQVKITVTP